MQVWFTGWLRKKKKKKEVICVVAEVFDLQGLLLNLNKRRRSFQTAAPHHMCKGVWTWRRQLSVILVISEHKRTVWHEITLLSALESVVSYVCFLKSWVNYLRKTFVWQTSRGETRLIVSRFFSVDFLWSWTHLAIPHMIDCLEWV